MGARRRASSSTRWVGRLRLPRLRAATTRSSRCASRASTRSSAAASSRAPGLDIDVSEYEEHFTESHVERSNALHSTLAGVGNYLVGPLARYALNYDELSPLAKEIAAEVGLGDVVPQPVPLASSCARSRRCTPPTRRCGSSRRTSRPSRRSSRRCRAPAPATAAPRRRAGSAGTATRSTTRARSSTRRSSRRPRRTRRRSRRTCSASSRSSLHLPDDELVAPLRADDPQLRPVHLLRDALPPPRGRAPVRAAASASAARYRGDDAVGPLVAERLRAAGAARARLRRRADAPDRRCGTGSTLVVIVDAVRSGARRRARVHRIDAGRRAAAARPRARLDARVLDRRHARARRARSAARRARVVVLGVEGAAFGMGDPLTPAVEAALPGVVDVRAAPSWRRLHAREGADGRPDGEDPRRRRGGGRRARSCGSASTSARSRTSRRRTSASTSTTRRAARSPRAPTVEADARHRPHRAERDGRRARERRGRGRLAASGEPTPRALRLDQNRPNGQARSGYATRLGEVSERSKERDWKSRTC